MSRTSSIPQDKISDLTQLLLSKTKVTDISQLTDISMPTIYYFKKKLVKAGAIASTRIKRKRRQTAANTATSEISSTKRTAVSAKPIANNTTPVSPSYEFTVNGMKVTINNAREVNFTSTGVDIKF